MRAEGNLKKMKVKQNYPVDYYLEIDNTHIYMNELIGKKIIIEFLNEINCMKCGAKTKKSFGQGYCYPCFISIPETEECVLRPELCKAHEGIARNMEYAKTHCLIDHYVYLAISSGLKVGVTRNSQVPIRWIDQGATQAIKLAKTPNRFIAGLIEVELKKQMADKTNWRNMLMNKIDVEINLYEEKRKAQAHLPINLQIYIDSDHTVYEFNYPVISYPEKVVSINLDKTLILKEKLTGIKGQYLLFESNKVINIRKFGGYKVRFDIEQ
ncbi:MAG: DUF2797 domain-containing protein [Chlorobi bacterium]|nr:DUF2797 domain-containing protein [Chlorobiota bacterium]